MAHLTVQNPLEMIDFFSILFKYMDGESLKSSTMVRKDWNEEGRNQFFKKHFLQVPQEFTFRTEQEKNTIIQQAALSLPEVTQFDNVLINRPGDVEIMRNLGIFNQTKIVKLNLEPMHITERVECVQSIIQECPRLTFLDCERYVELGMPLMKTCVNMKKNERLTIANLAIPMYMWSSMDTIEDFSCSGVRVINVEVLQTWECNPDTISRIGDIKERISASSKYVVDIYI